jgi:resuscitation-promoting factor RpfB
VISRNMLSGLLFAAAVVVAVPVGVPAAATAAPPAASGSAWAGAAVGGHPTTSGPVVQLGYQMAGRPPYHWAGQQALCLNWLWTRESDWSATAANPTSDARGIAQKITGWSAGYQPGNAEQQIAWGLNYIASTPYGTHTPCQAWAHEEAAGWY